MTISPAMLELGGAALGKGLKPSAASDSGMDWSGMFDNSGWNVNTGGGYIEAKRAESAPINWALIAAAALVLGAVVWRLAR